jgi:glyoxylase-like metal-dependent hydrolase (beta-lactamase superfamily II)
MITEGPNPQTRFVQVALALAGVVVISAAGPAPRIQAQAAQARPRPPQPSPPAADVSVLKVRDNVYMLSGAGANITVQTFAQGVTVVDTGLAQNADKVIAAIKQLSNKPIVHIINTSADPDHVGGNDKLAAAGRRIPEDIVAGDAAGAPEGPTIVAHEAVLARMSAPTGSQAAAPVRAWPTDTYHVEYKKLSAHFHGGEAIQLFHEPAAHSDGDTIVWFRHADLIMTGDLFTTTSYPVIKLEAGGSINGVIAGLNHILDVAFFDYRSEGGTMIVPGHGRLCDGADVGYYRDMVTIIRDRLQDAIKRGMTLPQVKAARLTRDYDGRYGSTTGPWTTDMFIEAVYKSLGGK